MPIKSLDTIRNIYKLFGRSLQLRFGKLQLARAGETRRAGVVVGRDVEETPWQGFLRARVTSVSQKMS